MHSKCYYLRLSNPPPHPLTFLVMLFNYNGNLPSVTRIALILYVQCCTELICALQTDSKKDHQKEVSFLARLGNLVYGRVMH